MSSSQELQNRFQDLQNGEIPEKEIEIRCTNSQSPQRCYQVYVEGETDEEMYGKTQYPFLNKDKATYYHGPSSGRDKTKGKKWVLNAHMKLMASEDKKNDWKSSIFIIDRDYECAENNGINVTKFHSIENYFFTEKNLRYVFSAFSIDKHNEFCMLGQQFAEKTMDYFLLLATRHAIFEKYGDVCVVNDPYNMDSLQIQKVYLNDMQRLKSVLLSGDYPEAQEYYEKLKSTIPVSILFIRGHNAYNLLLQYLRQQGPEGGINSSRLRGCFKKFDLETEFVDCEGNPLV